MRSAFLWLSFAIALSHGRSPRSRAPAAPLERVRAMLTPAPAQAARRSGWMRAMEELALVPVRPRPSVGRRRPTR
jgi:hypothetical protein